MSTSSSIRFNDYPQLLPCDSTEAKQGSKNGGNHWLKIRAVGTRSNRSGIGARVKCVTGSHQQIDDVRSGGSYASQSDLRLHFGLGQAGMADRIEIRWPSGQVDVLENVTADQLVYVQEGKGIVRSVKYKRMKYEVFVPYPSYSSSGRRRLGKAARYPCRLMARIPPEMSTFGKARRQFPGSWRHLRRKNLAWDRR